MPVDRPTAKSKLREILKVPNPKDNCTAMRHLSTDVGAIYCMYDLMVAYAKAGRKSREGDKATGPLVFNAAMNPTMCNELGVTKNTAYRWRDRLAELGWIILIKKGEPRGDGKQEPNVYRVVEHDQFITTHPDSCPPYAEPYDLAAKDAVREARRFIDDTTGRSFRFVDGDMTTAKAIVDAMSKLTAAEQAKVVELWKSIEPDPNVRTAPHKLPLPTQRDLAPATSTEVAASYLHTDCQLPTDGLPATSTENPSYLQTDLPLPPRREEPVTTPANTPVNTPATTPPTPSAAMMPLWLIRLWDKEKQTPLNLAKGHMAEIVALLRDERAHEFGKWDWLTGDVDYARRFATWEVMLEGAWFEFVTAKPEPWPDDFKYPIRKFLDNALPYLVRIQDRVKTKGDWNQYALERMNDYHRGNPDWIKWAAQVIDRRDGWHAKHGYSDDE